MTEQHTHSEQYQRARREFEDLRIEDKAIFLLEATVTTLARGIEEAGHAFAREIDALFRRMARREAEPSAPEPPPPPAPPTPPAGTSSEEETL